VSGPAHSTPFGRAAEAVERGDYERGSEAYRRRVDRRYAHCCSRRDIARLVDRYLTDGTVTFDTFHGVSGSRARWFDVQYAADAVGQPPAGRRGRVGAVNGRMTYNRCRRLTTECVSPMSHHS